MTEKWVVVQMYSDYSGVEEVHGIFNSKSEAEWWAATQYFAYEVKRIRKAVVDEWA